MVAWTRNLWNLHLVHLLLHLFNLSDDAAAGLLDLRDLLVEIIGVFGALLILLAQV